MKSVLNRNEDYKRKCKNWEKFLEYANRRFHYLHTKMHLPLSGNKLQDMPMKIGLFLNKKSFDIVQLLPILVEKLLRQVLSKLYKACTKSCQSQTKFIWWYKVCMKSCQSQTKFIWWDSCFKVHQHRNI